MPTAALGTRAPMVLPMAADMRWSLDFVSDQMTSGRRFRILCVVDDCTRECLALITDTSLSGLRVAHELDAIMAWRGKPAVIVSDDNGTELTSNAILGWAESHKVEWHYIAPGKPMQNGFVGHSNYVVASAFSPDGKRVVTASYDRTARLWDAETATEIAVLRGHQEGVLSAAFSPDGRRVVTASDDRTARLWDAETGTEIAVLKAHEDPVRSAAFSPDGRRVVTARSRGMSVGLCRYVMLDALDHVRGPRRIRVHLLGAGASLCLMEGLWRSESSISYIPPNTPSMEKRCTRMLPHAPVGA